MDKSTAGFRFRASHWPIASVTLAFLTVIAFDTLFCSISDHPLQSETSQILLQGPAPQEHAFNNILHLFDDATTPMPPTDPMTDHTARSTHPLPSDPYSDDDTQPIVQATIPAPTPAAGTGTATTDSFNPSSIQPAAATATRSRFKLLRTRGRGGCGTLPSEKSTMIMEGVQRVQNLASWIGKGTTTETKLRG